MHISLIGDDITWHFVGFILEKEAVDALSLCTQLDVNTWRGLGDFQSTCCYNCNV